MHRQTHVQPFFDQKTWTVSYVVNDIATKKAAVIDPVLDYDFKSGHTDTNAADALLAYVKAEQLTVQWILETHAHADHLSGARYLQERCGGKIAIGEHIREVQATFKSSTTSSERSCRMAASSTTFSKTMRCSRSVKSKRLRC